MASLDPNLIHLYFELANYRLNKQCGVSNAEIFHITMKALDLYSEFLSSEKDPSIFSEILKLYDLSNEESEHIVQGITKAHQDSQGPKASEFDVLFHC